MEDCGQCDDLCVFDSVCTQGQLKMWNEGSMCGESTGLLMFTDVFYFLWSYVASYFQLLNIMLFESVLRPVP